MSTGMITELAPPWRESDRRPSGPACTDLFLLALTTVNAAPQAARHKSRVILGEWNVNPEVTGTAVLLTSELVTNAVRFGQAPGMPPPSEISLALWRTRSTLVIEVSDQSESLPARRPTSPESESGRGLNMVHELSRQWGFYVPRPGWKTVYCVVAYKGVR
jgi:two-component sensor histidine kinase